jgi:hypothetical protein
MILPPLQVEYDFFAEQDPTSIILFGVVIVVFLLVLIIGARTSPASSSRGSPNRRRSSPPQRQFSRFAFRRAGRERGLNSDQIRILENLVKRYRVADPFRLLANSPVLDGVIAKAIDGIDATNVSEEMKESQKLRLYRIKQIVERASQRKGGTGSTRRLRIGQQIILIPQTGGRYPSVVTANLQKQLGVEIPVDESGKEVRWPKSIPVDVFVWRSDVEATVFRTKALGYNKLREVVSLFLQHSDHGRPAYQRRFRRKLLDKPAYCFPIQILDDGKRGKRTAIVQEHRRVLGTVSDLSPGGCGIKALTPFPKGQLLKIEFETQRQSPVTAFGKVQSLSPLQPRGGIMHVKFTRVSKKFMNKINAFVYGIGTEHSNRVRRY